MLHGEEKNVEAGSWTLPSEQRDFVEWRCGRPSYAVWALDVDVPDVRQASERFRKDFADWLLPGYCRQPHITLSLCGFPTAQAKREDDYPLERLDADIAALTQGGFVGFDIEIGPADSFSSAAYFKVGDPDGGIARLRRALAGEATDDFPYVPHVSVGLYRGAYPLDTMLGRIASAGFAEPLRMSIHRLALMSYEAAVIGGRLETLAEFDLEQSAWRVKDEQRMLTLFGREGI